MSDEGTVHRPRLDRRGIVLGYGDVVERVLESFEAEPTVQQAIDALPSEYRDAAIRRLRSEVRQRVIEASAGDSDAVGLQDREREFQDSLDALLTDKARAQPDEFKTRQGIAELQVVQDRLVAEERSLRKAAEDLRAEAETAKGIQAAGGASLSAPARRKASDVERRYVGTLEQLQDKKRVIADVITSKKRLEMRLPAAERDARQTIVSENSHLNALADEIETMRATVAKRRLAELQPDIAEVVTNAVGTLPTYPAPTEPGPPDLVLTTSDSAEPAVSETGLRHRILDLSDLADHLRVRSQRAVLSGVLGAGLLPIALLLLKGMAQVLVSTYFASLAVAACLLAVQQRQRARVVGDQLTDVQNELDLLRIEHEHPERRALKMLQVNQLDLRRYYSQTLRQGRLVFYLGIACIVLGFAAVGAALLLVTGPSQGSTEKIAVASLGAVSALLANFIGVIYLRMFSGITASVGAFHTRLVGTHDLYFGNFLAAKVTDEGQREALFGDLAREVGRTRNAHPDANTST